MFFKYAVIWALLFAVGCARWRESAMATALPLPSDSGAHPASVSQPTIKAPQANSQTTYRGWDRTREDLPERPLPSQEPLVQTVAAEQEPHVVEVAVDELILPELTDESLPLAHKVHLEQVIHSVYHAYPLLEAVLYTRNIAQGDHLSAHGAFDLLFSAASENEPLGYYKNSRQRIGLEQPLLSGGEVFTGYRIGRGDIQPWYKGRQTDDGGEFRGGLVVPLMRNREIDARRANLWKTDIGRFQVEAEIQAQLIMFVQAASHAYWDWIAAGQSYLIAEQILHFAQDRTERLRRQVEEELIDRPVLIDNLRLVAERQARLAEARRRREQAAARLSLYLRDEVGRPITPAADQLLDFGTPFLIDADGLGQDIQRAIQSRPELLVVGMTLQQLSIDAARARNEFLPNLDAELVASKDVGGPATSLRDKSEFELEASLFLDVPLQRRFARGQINATDGRIGQLLAMRRMIEDRIVVDVQVAYAALVAAHEEAVEARQAVEHAEEVSRVERRFFDLGRSDLLTVALREQFAAESAQLEVDALRRFFQALADYRAALAIDRLSP